MSGLVKRQTSGSRNVPDEITVRANAAALERLAMDKHTRAWLDQFEAPTSKRYLRALGRFQKWLGKKPTRLLLEGRRRGPDDIRLELTRYRKDLVDRGLAPNSADQYTTILRSYFAAGGVYLGRFHRKTRIPQKTYPPPTPDYLTRQNVSDMVKSRNSMRDKFIVAFLAQTGQRVGILTAMKRDMMTKKVMRGHGIVRVPETLRNRQGRNVNKLRRQYTFVVGRDAMKLLKLLDRVSLYEGGWLLHISSRQIGRIVDEAAETIGIQKKGPTTIGELWSAVHPNTLREYWRERMREAKADLPSVLHMWGSNVPSTYGVHEFRDDELLKEYEQAETKLSLNAEPEVGTS